MKMIPTHFQALRAKLTPMDTEENRAAYAAAGHSTRRYQWDLVRASGALPFVCDTLYTYLDDTHIQTALDRIVQPLALPSIGE